ncbi:cuticle protein 16.8 [Trichonephila clavipes]|uniref:Cuticle protein 16.8 n=1 Tax=Trichonephila clavipes TaxID=2585209 RepID=A0A8X6V0Q2_TRICX|nr:cuticle protein 16.8 [Trichonephila clavipes]
MNAALSRVALLSLIAVVTSSLVPVAELFKTKPYKFGYAIKDKNGEQYREEVGDGLHDVKGSYGFVDDRGIKRQVNYVADKGGFRAEVKTNEPGTAPQDPAAVKMVSEPIPGEIKVAESTKLESSLAELEKFFKSSAEMSKKSYEIKAAEKDFLKEFLGKKVAEETEASKAKETEKVKLSLEQLTKLGLLYPPLLELYAAEKGLAKDDLSHLKYKIPDELLLLSLLSKEKAASSKGFFLAQAAALNKMTGLDSATKFGPVFGKVALQKDLGLEYLLKGIALTPSTKKSLSYVPIYGI